MSLGKSTEKEASGPVGGEERSCLSVDQSCGLQKSVLSGYKLDTFAWFCLKCLSSCGQASNVI